MTSNSPLLLPKNSSAQRDMKYECIDLLYHQKEIGVFGDHSAFILGCSGVNYDNTTRGILHKLDVTSAPNYAQATIQVTHEVSPGLFNCNQIIPVSTSLKAACYSRGAVMPITNFGPRKTFHSDVRGSLYHHRGEVHRLVTGSGGSRMASGDSSGCIAIYQIDVEQISFLTSTTHTGGTFITGLSFVPEPSTYSADHPYNNILLYSTINGHVGLIDTRCGLVDLVVGEPILTSEPRQSITAMMCPRSKPGNNIYLGGAQGEIVAYDLRELDQPLMKRKPKEEGLIRCMKEIVVDGKTFLAHTNLTNNLVILDIETLQQDKVWKSDRLPDGEILDLVQVENRIVTCGDKLSVGCWEWDPEPIEDE